MKKILFILLPALCLFMACKKNNYDVTAPPDASSFRVKTSVSANESLEYSYDMAGRLIQRLDAVGTKIIYEYPAGKVLQKVYQSAMLSDLLIYKLDANGLCYERTVDGVPDYLETYVHNNDKQIVKDITQSGPDIQVTENFFSNGNGDSTRYSTNGVWSFTVKHTYYTDKLNVLASENFGQQYYGKGSKNLMKS